jgi:hypothetical protein
MRDSLWAEDVYLLRFSVSQARADSTLLTFPHPLVTSSRSRGTRDTAAVGPMVVLQPDLPELCDWRGRAKTCMLWEPRAGVYLKDLAAGFGGGFRLEKKGLCHCLVIE